MNDYDEKKTHSRFYTIGNISKQYHISPDALRYYENKGLIKPHRSQSGYRLYSSHDIWRLNVIEDLRSLQFPVERIRSYLNEGTVDATVQILNDELTAIDEQMMNLLSIKKRIQTRLSDINTARCLTLNEISIKHLPDRSAYFLKSDFSTEEDMDRLMKALAEGNGEKVDLIGNNQMAALLSPLTRESNLYSGALMFHNNGDYHLPEGDYLSICYSGEWNSRHYAEKLISYAEENHILLDDTFYDLIWIDIHTAVQVNEHISEVQVKIV